MTLLTYSYHLSFLCQLKHARRVCSPCKMSCVYHGNGQRWATDSFFCVQYPIVRQIEAQIRYLIVQQFLEFTNPIFDSPIVRQYKKIAVRESSNKSHFTVQYVKQLAKITNNNNRRTASSSKFKRNSRNASNTGTPATATHQELKGRQQQQECLHSLGTSTSSNASNNSSTSNKQQQG